MTKIRKQKRRKKFRYNVNRKKLRQKEKKTLNISCSEIKKNWEMNKSVEQNMKDMGLAYDVNKSLEFLTEKKKGKSKGKTRENVGVAPKNYVAEALEEEARAPRVKKLRLPDGQVRWLSYLITQYGEDYKAMSRDAKNHYALTWKQIRAKINKFKSIPDQYNEFLTSQVNSNMDTS